MIGQRLLLALFVIVVVGANAVFTVSETERALLLKFGEILRSDFEPGLHFKFPFINQVRKFDRPLLSLESQPERFLTSEKKDVIVDAFVRWRITDVAKYFRGTQGIETQAGLILYQKVNAALRNEFGKRTVHDVVSGERGKIMDIVTRSANEQVKDLGMAIVDVRVSRIDLPAEVSNSVYQRMRAERERVARDFRSRGAEAAERIRATADRERAVILAEANRDAATTRGEGDAAAAEIYARTFGANQEFYSLYRSLRAYRNSFRNNRDILVLEPDSHFFKYFDDPATR
jgi:membrane protease subunit HflC